MIRSKKQMYIVVSAFAIILMLFTTTYAFFNYTRTGTANTIRTGRIAFNTEQGTAINLTNMFPIDVSEGIPNDATKVGTVTINVIGDTTYTEGLEYLVSAVNVTNSVGSKLLPISIDVAISNNTNNDPATTLGTSDDDYFIDRGEDTSYYKVLAGETINTDDQLVVGYIAPGQAGVDGNIVIRAYLDSSKIAITDTYDGNENDNMGTTTNWVDDRTVFTTTEWNSLQQNGVSFQIKVESNEGIWLEGLPKQAEILSSNYSSRTSCMTKLDYYGPYQGDINDGKVIYYNGSTESCLQNYVWYSGKLWRIVAIYPDGKMKLVTENSMTSLRTSDYASYTNSEIVKWLDDVFLPTLYNANKILVVDAEWNIQSDSANNESSVSDPYNMVGVDNPTTINKTVGMLNAYEFVKIGNLITNGQTIRLSNKFVNSDYNTDSYYLVHSYQNNLGFVDGNGGSSMYTAVKPAIYLQEKVRFTSGTGMRNDPYHIKGDITVASDSALLNTRINGEYVVFNNEVYRIIGNENNTTKIIMAGVLKNNGSIVNKYFGEDAYFDTPSSTDSYWDYYLPNVWLTEEMKTWLENGTYYKDIPYSSYDVIKDGTQYSSLVGMPTLGEMFSAYQSTNVHEISFTPMWYITQTSSTLAHAIRNYWSTYDHNTLSASSNSYAARPTLNLKSTVKITCNSELCDGTYFHPYDLTLN